MSKLRTLEDVIQEYEEARKDNTMCSDPNYHNIYRFKNQPVRDKLQREYEELLPENQRMAILLHKALCHSNHTDRCGWYYEINGIEHDWTRWTHKEYLEKANKLIQSGITIDVMKTVFECLD